MCFIYIKCLPILIENSIAQLVGAAEYIDCISAEEWDSPNSVIDMIIDNQKMRFQ